MKKILCLLWLLFCFYAYTKEIKVFDLNFLDDKEIVFYLYESLDGSYAIFLDEKKAEANVVFCYYLEFNELKKIAFECKILMNSVNNRTSYEEQNIYQKIVNKLKAFAPNLEEVYDSLDDYGLLKINFLTKPLSIDPNIPTINQITFNEKSRASKKLVVWSFTDELQTMVDKYYKLDHPDIEVEYSLTPTDQFPNKLDSVLAFGNGAPDVFTLEDAFVRKYIELGDRLLLDLTDVYNEIKNKMISYPFEVATHNGKVYAMSWQACPGAFFYRRSLAKKYLGTDDPATVQKSFANWDNFIATARYLKKASGGKCVVISSTGDLYQPFLCARKGPWIQGGKLVVAPSGKFLSHWHGGKLVVDPAMETYMETAKLMKDEGLEGGQRQWSEGWFAGFKGELKDEAGKAVEVFGTFLPTWGLHYVLKPNAGNTAGDWAMVAGPTPYRWGGTWVAAYKGTKVPKLAKEFIKYVATDDSFLTRWAKDTGDVVSNNNVINAIKDTYSEPFLSGQNHYAEFAEMANHVDGKTVQGTDQAVEGFWGEAVGSYVNGEKSKADALADFKKHVADELGF